MVKYWIAKYPNFDFQTQVYDENQLQSFRDRGCSITEVTSAGLLIRLWTATNDLGDGTSNCKIFTSKKEAEEWADNNEYFPEVNSVVIDAELFEKVGKYT